MITNKRVVLINALSNISKSNQSDRVKAFNALMYVGLCGSFMNKSEVPLFKLVNESSNSTISLVSINNKGVTLEYSKFINGSISNGCETVEYSNVINFLMDFYVGSKYDGFVINYNIGFSLWDNPSLEGDLLEAMGLYHIFIPSYGVRYGDSYGTLLCLWLVSNLNYRYSAENRFRISLSPIVYRLSGYNYDTNELCYTLESTVYNINPSVFLTRVFNGDILLGTGDLQSSRSNDVLEPYEFVSVREEFAKYIGKGFDSLFGEYEKNRQYFKDESKTLETPFSVTNEEVLVLGDDSAAEVDPLSVKSRDGIDISSIAEGRVVNLDTEGVVKGGPIKLVSSKTLGSELDPEVPELNLPFGVEVTSSNEEEDDESGSFDIKRKELFNFLVKRGMVDRLVNNGTFVSMKSNVLIGGDALVECGISEINNNYFTFLHIENGELVSSEYTVSELYENFEKGNLHINKVPSLAGQKIYIIDMD